MPAAEEPKAGVSAEVLARSYRSLPSGFLKRAIWPLRSDQFLLTRVSAQGQSLPNWTFRTMSASPSIATELRTSRIGSFVPEAVMEAYSITSVAKPKTDVGISMPSIFAVFKFTTNSNLLD